MITTISLMINVAAIALLVLKLGKKKPQIKVSEVRERPAGIRLAGAWILTRQLEKKSL